MNYSILNQYGITFQKQNNGNIKIKANSKSLDNFLYMLCRDEQKLKRLIFTLNQVIANGYNSISEQDKYWDIEIHWYQIPVHWLERYYIFIPRVVYLTFPRVAYSNFKRKVITIYLSNISKCTSSINISII